MSSSSGETYAQATPPGPGTSAYAGIPHFRNVEADKRLGRNLLIGVGGLVAIILMVSGCNAVVGAVTGVHYNNLSSTDKWFYVGGYEVGWSIPGMGYNRGEAMDACDDSYGYDTSDHEHQIKLAACKAGVDDNLNGIYHDY